jgi:hypothetical protein
MGCKDTHMGCNSGTICWPVRFRRFYTLELAQGVRAITLRKSKTDQEGR